MYNPRFPYKLAIKRPVLDAYGEPVLNPDGTPTFESVKLIKAIYFDGELVRDEYGEVCTELVDDVEFGYRTESLSSSTDGDVVVSHLTLHAPLIYNEFQYGFDIAVINDDKGEWEGKMVGKKNFNWGSNIFIDNVMS